MQQPPPTAPETALSPTESRLLLSMAEAIIPASVQPLALEDSHYLRQVSWWLGRLPRLEAQGIRLAMLGLRWALPALLGRLGPFERLDVTAREQALSRLFASPLMLGRSVARLVMMLVGPMYYSDPRIQRQLGAGYTDRPVPPDPVRFPILDASACLEGLEADVVIVGSGAGGAPLARELAEQGHDVVVLEAGGYRHSGTFPTQPVRALTELYAQGGLTVSLGAPPIPIPLGAVVGGTTVVNSGTCFRIPDFVHEKWASAYGLGQEHGLDLEALAAHYARVEDIVSVHPVSDDVLGANNQVARRGAEALGWSHGPLRRNAAGCMGRNLCVFGCRGDAKQAMHVSYLPRAAKAGARIVQHARVGRVLRRGGRAIGVEAVARDASGRKLGTFEVRARVVVLSAGTLASPLLLRASGIRNRHLGRHLTLHPALKVSGDFEGEDFLSGPGVPQSWYVDEFHRQGVMMEGAHVPPDVGTLGTAGVGAAFGQKMLSYRSTAMYGFLVSDEGSGRVRRGPGGRPLVTYNLAPADLEKILLGLEKVSELMFAAGAQRLHLPVWHLPTLEGPEEVARIRSSRIRRGDIDMAAFHPLGTCRMGHTAARSVVTPELRVHGTEGLYVCDGSVFPSSLAVNPQLSIMALSTRLAGTLQAELEGRSA